MWIPNGVRLTDLDYYFGPSGLTVMQRGKKTTKMEGGGGGGGKWQRKLISLSNTWCERERERERVSERCISC